MVLSKFDHPFCEFEQRFCIIVPVPIEPVQWIVLTIGIVIALLRARKLVPAVNHRDPLREYQCGDEIALLPPPKRVYRWIIGWPFRSTIPGIVVVIPVAIFFPVGLVVFV